MYNKKMQRYIKKFITILEYLQTYNCIITSYVKIHYEKNKVFYKLSFLQLF